MQRIGKVGNNRDRQEYHNLSPYNVLSNFSSNENGLSKDQVDLRLKEYGQNVFNEHDPDSLYTIVIRQFKSPLIYVLLIAAFIVLALSEWQDSLIIFFVIGVNALVGSFEEIKARNSLEALKNLSNGKARVFRDGSEKQIDDIYLVPGDIIVLRQGEKVPADARMINLENLKVDESPLTGESEPVEKKIESLPLNTELPDRINMVYKGTLVVSGRASAVVVSTGGNTVFGKVAEKISLIDTDMPLKKKIEQLSRFIGFAIFMAISIYFYIGIVRGMPLFEIIISSVAIAVSLIPEGLPVVITLVLARGVYRMAKRNALVKNMQAVEALGQASVIAVDKTGTITKNELAVLSLFINNEEYAISGSGYEPVGDVSKDGNNVEILNHADLIFAGKIAALSADASIDFDDSGQAHVSGDPTEASLLVFGEKIGFKQNEILSENQMVFEKPFSYDNRFRLTVHKNNDKYLVVAVGEPESILKLIGSVWTPEGSIDITDEYRESILVKIDEFGARGLRVIMFASAIIEDLAINMGNMPSLSFGGLFGMADVLRDGVVDAIEQAKDSGIKVVMITGDHLGTARSIAQQAHIWEEGDGVVSGNMIKSIINEGNNKLDAISVFGRVLPEHKLDIVEAYKKRGDIIGMTGDGVNDAMSLRAAHLGLAIGSGGTDVAKEASDIILLDNNFHTIVAAIEEGRSIYSTIKKVVLYLISTSIGEFLAIAGAVAIGLPLPLTPSQILWLNLVTNGVVVVALAFEPNTPLAQGKRPRSAIFGSKELVRSLIMGAVMMVGTLFIFMYSLNNSLAFAWTMSLTLLAVFQWFNIWNCRSQTKPFFFRFFSNHYLLLAIAASFVLHLFAIYTKPMQDLLKTVPISFENWVTLIVIGSSILWVEELRKLFIRILEKDLRIKY